MRVIAGEHRGRRLIVPKGLDVRPTADRVKQFIFDVLSGEIEGADVLDLFAGTGNLGIEALSRGAAHATFVDQNTIAAKTITQNIELLGLETRSTLIKRDVISVIKHSDFPPFTFNLIFADPPYDYENHRMLLMEIAEKKLLHPEGWLILEHPTSMSLNGTFERLAVSRVRKLGNTSISMFKNDNVNDYE
ncbi:16S rRNA (guanine(966)-N(2))-methyltransferase RsmD [candidate division KSB1 bacterium]|nr:16S rRNA (guanine(966)-N(2))-methyltransferase RsmD [candidate division KSB1 bacterium]